MAEHNELGKYGEKKAIEFLQNKGYTILETNWVFQKAEVDVIAIKDNVLVATEVKTRSSLLFGLPQDFVTPKKIKLVTKAINQYIEQKNLDVHVRFDIISVYKNDNHYDLEHIEDAFYFF